jgi:HEPN domain-containing protein
MVPGVVCAAFAIELGIKAIALAKGAQPKGHKLDALFGSLDLAEQSALKTAVGLSDLDFQKEIKAAADAFVEWRYIYEATGTVSANLEFLQRLSTAVQNRL